MRLICRDEHDDMDLCPPHDFEAGWQTSDDSGDPMGGVIYCKACGDVRSLTPPTIGPSHVETAVYQAGEDRRSR